MPALEKKDNGDLKIFDGRRVVGTLISLGNDKFRIQVGEYGGFFNLSLSFDEALKKLIDYDVSTHEKRMKTVWSGANLIYKRSIKR